MCICAHVRTHTIPKPQNVSFDVNTFSARPCVLQPARTLGFMRMALCISGCRLILHVNPSLSRMALGSTSSPGRKFEIPAALCCCAGPVTPSVALFCSSVLPRRIDHHPSGRDRKASNYYQVIDVAFVPHFNDNICLPMLEVMGG